MYRWHFLLVLALVCTGCMDMPEVPVDAVSEYMPAHFPAVPVPADNPMNAVKVELGHYLFYDRQLSRNGTVACASCHNPAQGFTDSPQQVSRGIDNQSGVRNAPSIVNAAYATHLFWDGRTGSLEEQAMAAFTNAAEMAADTHAVNRYLRRTYADLWVGAFGDTTVSCRRAMQAIATWERTVISGRSRYDRFVNGDTTVMTPQERHGMQLFFSDRTMCASCHSGVNFTDGQFYNIGLFFHYFDRGRYEVTKKGVDDAKFKTPGLRNVALTAPYMASGDGQKGIFSTLEKVVEHYDEGGTSFPSKDSRIRKLGLSQQERDALVAFMKTLTDTTLLKEPRVLPIFR